MSTIFVIKVPTPKNRNPLQATCTGKRQVFKDKRDKRSKDARRKREAFGEE